MSKIAAVIQKPEETPTDFYERLCEAFWVHNPFELKGQKTSEWSIQCLWHSYRLTFTGNSRNLKVSLK
jgi:hypothetical protein